jgi:cytochrome c peroxidase
MIFLKRFFWDGRARSPEEQLAGPLFSKDEMNMSPEKLWRRLLETPDLLTSIQEVYPRSPKESPPESPQDWAVHSITDALVSYQATLLAFDSPYDRWALGDQKALTQDQFLGYNIFRSFVSRCAECHIPPLFTSGQLVVIGAPDHPKAGLDLGAAEGGGTTARAFKVPTLRNITLTAPYMHGGSLQTLGEILKFYNRGGGRALGTHMPKDLHWHIRPMTLSPRELQLLEIFLGSLTDRP